MEDQFILRNEIEQSDVSKFDISEEEYSKRQGKTVKKHLTYVFIFFLYC